MFIPFLAVTLAILRSGYLYHSWPTSRISARVLTRHGTDLMQVVRLAVKQVRVTSSEKNARRNSAGICTLLSCQWRTLVFVYCGSSPRGTSPASSFAIVSG